MLGLSWSDVDTQGRTVRVERQLTGRAAAWRSRPRGRAAPWRAPPTSPRSSQSIGSRTAARRARRSCSTRPDGRHWTHSAADRALAVALRDAGLPGEVTWHDLRHGHVSRLFAAGVDAVTIAARIGDTIAIVLSTYAHEYDATRRRADESARMVALYDDAGDYGSAMEARGSNTAQQSATDVSRDSALDRGIRSIAQ